MERDKVYDAVEAALCKWFRTPPNKNMVDGIVDAVMNVEYVDHNDTLENLKRGKHGQKNIT